MTVLSLLLKKLDWNVIFAAGFGLRPYYFLANKFNPEKALFNNTNYINIA
jgi:hypothetical protein